MPNVLEFVLGLVVVVVAFRDLVQTVVVPGGARNTLHVSRRLVAISLPLWTRGFRREIGTSFAPVILIASFATWVMLLIVGFGLMAHAVRTHFQPSLHGFGDALFAAGGAFTTLGTGMWQPHGIGSAVAVLAGLGGLASMTMAMTYVLEVQATVHERDRGVLKIATSAGDPPSALALLEHYAALGCQGELRTILHNARDWCAAVLQSHSSHPWLIYFRTPSVQTAWPTSLGVVMDLSLVFELLIDEAPMSGLGALARRQAATLSTQLAGLLKLECHAGGQPAPDSMQRDADALVERLRRAGYRLRETPDIAGFVEARRRRAAPIDAICRHLGADGAPLVCPPAALDPP